MSLSGGLADRRRSDRRLDAGRPASPAAVLAGGSALFAGGYDDLFARPGRAARRQGPGRSSARAPGGPGERWSGQGRRDRRRCVAGRPGAPIDGRELATVRRTLTGAALIAGSANLMNLFDLRPGRAAKVGWRRRRGIGVDGRSSPAAVTVGATGAVLPDDLGERTMLGDLGANTARRADRAAARRRDPTPVRIARRWRSPG